MAAENVPFISVHYIGPALEDERIDVLVLADALRGLGRLTSRASYILYGSNFDHRLELDASIRGGSVIIPLHIFSAVLQQAESGLLTPGVQALANLMSILGFGVGPAAITLYKLFKLKRGRPITDDDDFERLLRRLENLERLLLVRLYNDQEVQAAIRSVLRPLRVEGIVEFQTRREEVVIDTVTKGDLLAADTAEEGELPEIEEKVLDIEKAALLPHLAWHFRDGRTSFDAKIHDVDLWARVAQGERFGFGDTMRVQLHTSYSRDVTGRLTVERVIPKVIEVDHSTNSQRPLWLDELGSSPGEH